MLLPNWKGIFGPCVIKSLHSVIPSTLNRHEYVRSYARAGYGGVAVLNAMDIPAVPTDTACHDFLQELRLTNRWVECFVPCAGHDTKGYFVASLYADPNSDNTRLFELAVLAAARVSTQVPYFICADMQKDVHTDPWWARVFSTGLLADLACATQSSCLGLPTFCRDVGWSGEDCPGATTIDFIIGNPAAVTITNSVSRDVCPFSSGGHCALRASLSVEAFSSVGLRVSLPKPYLIAEAPEVRADDEEEFVVRAWEEVCVEYSEAVLNHNTSYAFLLWSRVAEKFLDNLLFDNSANRGTHGRGKTPIYERKPVIGRVEDAAIASAETKVLALFEKLFTKSNAFLKRRIRCDRVGTTLFDAQELENSWHNIIKLLRLLPVPTGGPAVAKSRPTTPITAASMHDFIQHWIGKRRLARQHFQEERVRRWRNTLKLSYTTNKKDIFRYLNKKNDANIRYIVDGDNAFHFDINDVLEQIVNAWQPIDHALDQNQNQDFIDNFFEEYAAEVLVADEKDLPKLRGMHLRKALQHMHNTRSCGLDGWRVPEARRLPIFLLDKLVVLFEAVEGGAPWPDCMVHIPCPCLSKGDGHGPLDLRRLGITSVMYGAWAKSRYVQVQPTRDRWELNRMFGGTSNRSVSQAAWPLQIEIDTARIAKHPLLFKLLDRKKMFDRIHRNLAFQLHKPPARQSPFSLPDVPSTIRCNIGSASRGATAMFTNVGMVFFKAACSASTMPNFSWASG